MSADSDTAPEIFIYRSGSSNSSIYSDVKWIFQQPQHV